MFRSMHAVICLTFGMNSRQSLIASARQALRCSAVPEFACALSARAEKASAASSVIAAALGRPMFRLVSQALCMTVVSSAVGLAEVL